MEFFNLSLWFCRNELKQSHKTSSDIHLHFIFNLFKKKKTGWFHAPVTSAVTCTLSSLANNSSWKKNKKIRISDPFSAPLNALLAFSHPKKYLLPRSPVSWAGSLSSVLILCSSHEPFTCPPIVLNFFALSLLSSCQPTKALHASQCRRMRIITSLLYSVVSPVPASHTHSQHVREYKEMICHAHQKMH